MAEASKWFAMALTLAITSCSGVQPTPATRASGAGPFRTSPSKIQHVVMMIQENRSFDDFFATFPGAVGATKGLMKTPTGDVTVPLTEAGLSQIAWRTPI